MVFYKKNKNLPFIAEMETKVDVLNGQNYIPIYKRFFTLNTTNWNSINLKNPNELLSIQECDYNQAIVSIQNTSTSVFFKFSPLLDPLKYMVGKYSDYDFSLPSLQPTIPKLDDVNNSAYTDSFFSYLSSQLLHTYDFKHSINFHGSFLGIKRDFKYNIEDEMEQLQHAPYFHEHKNNLFTLNRDIEASGSRKNREKLNIQDEQIELTVENIECTKLVSDTLDDSIIQLDICIPEQTQTTDIKDDTSSKSSNTDNEFQQNSETSEDYDNYDIYATIHKFPVQIIALEKCKDTLDSLLMDYISPEEITSALMQVIMTLIVYQNVFKFTHNDLHTNNIMYIPTDEPYLYYSYKDIRYKVPTFGRIFKIIDFGRAIYTYDGKRFVSDSFHPDGDAATQYNIEPFLDFTKPILEPNYSFDLCRLACSMIDMLPDESPVYELVDEWCNDDKNRNIMYKKNGEERYPDFKLYKMIARTVHNHIPELQLKKPIFSQYITTEEHESMDLNNLINTQ